MEKANSVPIDTRSASTSRGTKKASTPTMAPVMTVATMGLSVRGLMRAWGMGGPRGAQLCRMMWTEEQQLSQRLQTQDP